MLVAEALLAFFIAIVLSLVLVGIFGWQHPGRIGIWPSIVFLVLILFAATWAGGAWIHKAGPHWGSLYWVPFVVVGIFLALLIATLIPPGQRPRNRREALEQVDRRRESGALIGILVWIVLIALFVIALVRYV